MDGAALQDHLTVLLSIPNLGLPHNFAHGNPRDASGSLTPTQYVAVPACPSPTKRLLIPLISRTMCACLKNRLGFRPIFGGS